MGKTCSTCTVHTTILIGKRRGNRRGLSMRKEKADFHEIGCKVEDWI
jgi:ABC-type uncharacterized transport system ATPase component